MVNMNTPCLLVYYVGLDATSNEKVTHTLPLMATEHAMFSTIRAENDSLPWHLFISPTKEVFWGYEGGIQATPWGGDQLMDTPGLLAGGHYTEWLQRHRTSVMWKPQTPRPPGSHLNIKTCGYLSLLGLKLIHVSKKVPCTKINCRLQTFQKGSSWKNITVNF